MIEASPPVASPCPASRLQSPQNATMKRSQPHPWTNVGLGLCLTVLWASAASADEPPVDFNRQIRPILAAHCFACHGPDAAERKAELRLDTEDGATADLGGHRAIVPGDIAHSALVERISSSDPESVMPPADSGKKLTAEQIVLLKRWVAEGARWQRHWAYARASRPPVPQSSPANDSDNPIDLFVRAGCPRCDLRLRRRPIA